MPALHLSVPSVVSLVTLLAGIGTRGPISRTQYPSATAPTVVEYKIPRAGNFPHDPAVGPDGIVWYTDQTNSYICMLDPATCEITD